MAATLRLLIRGTFVQHPRKIRPFVLVRSLYSPLFIACIAFALRVVILYRAWHQLPSAFDTRGSYGYEVGQVAASITSGRGFSSPSPLVDTGPTAWLCPAYPYLVAAVFKAEGIFSAKSHVILQILNCLFAALTIFPIFAIARRSFGIGVALAASWLWVVLPTAWHMPIQYVWDTTLSALWFAILFWATLAIREERRPMRWAAYGSLWVAGAMINASFLSVFPFLLIWLAWTNRKVLARLTVPFATLIIIFVLGIAPWTLRNYRIFGTFIPVRLNVGFMLWLGNNPGTVDVDAIPRTPFLYQPEATEYGHLGELGYMQLKQHQALAFMRSHPYRTIGFMLRRFWLTWFSVTDRPHNIWDGAPLYLKVYFVLNAIMILAAWFGVGAALRSGNPEAAPYLLVVLIYPSVYYVTSTLLRYRFPIDPILTILAVYGSAFAFVRLLKKRAPLGVLGTEQLGSVAASVQRNLSRASPDEN